MGGSLVVIAMSNGSKEFDHVEKVIKAYKLCLKSSKRHIEKVYPSESPRASPEPTSPVVGEKVQGHEEVKMVNEERASSLDEFRDCSLSPQKMRMGRVKSFGGHPSGDSLHQSPIQSDDEAEECGRHYFSSMSDYYHENSDTDTGSVSLRNGSYSLRSAGSSPLDSPSRYNINTPRAGVGVQQQRGGSPKPQNSTPCHGSMAVLKRLDEETEIPENTDSRADQMSIAINQDEEFVLKPLDFKNNDLWLPPLPKDGDDEGESNYFGFEDDDDDEDRLSNVARSSCEFSSCSSPSNLLWTKGKQNGEQTRPLKVMVHGHFRALVSQLLQGEGDVEI